LWPSAPRRQLTKNLEMICDHGTVMWCSGPGRAMDVAAALYLWLCTHIYMQCKECPTPTCKEKREE